MAAELKFAEVKDGIQNGTVTLVDVRGQEELKSNGSIPGSFNVPLAEIQEAFKMTGNGFKDKYGFDKAATNLCFSCQGGKRAQQAIDKLKGIVPDQNMKIYKGSFGDWKANGGKIDLAK